MSLHFRQSFKYFATNPAIQCTELYEYCQTLGGKGFSIPSFQVAPIHNQISFSHLWSCLTKSDECCIQVYKFLYAGRLLDCGLASQAFHYCEVVGQAILRQREAFFVLTGEVIKVCSFTHIHIQHTLYSVLACIG